MTPAMYPYSWDKARKSHCWFNISHKISPLNFDKTIASCIHWLNAYSSWLWVPWTSMFNLFCWYNIHECLNPWKHHFACLNHHFGWIFTSPNWGGVGSTNRQLGGADWNMAGLWLSHHIGNGIIIPTDFHSIIFQRGRSTTNQKWFPAAPNTMDCTSESTLLPFASSINHQ